MLDRDISMFRDGLRPLRASTASGRFLALAVSAALVVTVIEPLPATARSAAFSRSIAAGMATDFSAARRRGHAYRHHVSRYHGRRYGAGPGIAMMGMMIGAIGAIANAERRRAYYEDAPVVYAPQPYYGVQPYDEAYAPSYYAPQPGYPVAPVYAAPVAPAYRAGSGFVPRIHAGPPVVHTAPHVNVVRAMPRILPQGHPHHH
jgi:hypothetical protein